VKNEFEELYRASSGPHFGISLEEFKEHLEAISRNHLGENAGRQERLKFYKSLHMKDLVFVQACLKGNEQAWTSLVHRYRTKLFFIALQISKEEVAAREMSDSLFADLFGVSVSPQGKQASKLKSYGGRCSLEGWLRALLVQAFVDRQRRERKFIPLHDLPEMELSVPETDCQQCSPLLDKALDMALAELGAEERFLLSGHFLDGRSKAELASMLAVHETTVGRQIAKALKNVRRRTILHLCSSGLSLSTARDMLTSDVRALRLNARQRLLADEV
jgi:RNA polymerase sigma-70 factor, ECF subfamily